MTMDDYDYNYDYNYYYNYAATPPEESLSVINQALGTCIELQMWQVFSSIL